MSKGSFYWHFADVNGYRAALLELWERNNTARIIEVLEGQQGDASSKLRRLMTLTVAADASLAQTVRAWGEQDEEASAAVRRVDRRRLDYLGGLIAALGWPAEDAETLALWAYCALLGRFSLRGPALTERQSALILATLAFRPSPGAPA